MRCFETRDPRRIATGTHEGGVSAVRRAQEPDCLPTGYPSAGHGYGHDLLEGVLHSRSACQRVGDSRAKRWPRLCDVRQGLGESCLRRRERCSRHRFDSLSHRFERGSSRESKGRLPLGRLLPRLAPGSAARTSTGRAGCSTTSTTSTRNHREQTPARPATPPCPATLFVSSSPRVIAFTD